MPDHVFQSGLKEAIDKVESLVREAAPLQVLTPFADRRHVALLVKQTGSYEQMEQPPKLHSETLKTPQELADFIKFIMPPAFTADRVEGISTTDNTVSTIDAGTVMIAEPAIVYAYVFNSRQDTASVPLQRSKQYKWLMDNDDKPVKQVPLEKTLRITFRDTNNGELLAAVKNLKFAVNADSEGTIGTGGNSFSKNVTSKVTGVDKLPEVVTFRINLFDNFPFPVEIDAAVSADILNEAIVLTVYPASLLKAQTETFDAIKALYEVPAFAGSF